VRQVTTGQISVGAGNQDQYGAWNSDEGGRWAASPGFYDASVRRHHRVLLEAAGIGPGDQVLDIGCGTGQSTRDAARRTAGGTALGIDLSLPMIEVAQATARREGLTHAAFVHADAQVHAFPPAAFDVALSRFGSMFFADQAGAFANIGRALRPAARLLLVSWRSAAENEWISALRQALVPGGPAPEATANAPGAFRHAGRDDTIAILATAGYNHIGLEPLDLPIYFGRDAADAFSVLGPLFGWMVRYLDPGAADQAFDRMRQVLLAHQTADGVAFGSATWLITARHSPEPQNETGARP
jgi:SAM-dependent methyltransferase